MKNFTFRNYVLLSVATLILGQTAVSADTTTTIGNVTVKTKTAPLYPQYHNRIAVFLPEHQAYERIKNDDIYAGVEAWAAPRIGGHSGAVGDVEFRMGYNYFYNGRDHFTPFVGVGAFKDFHKHHERETVVTSQGLTEVTTSSYRRATFGYGTIGFKYTHEFNSIFNLGADFKALVGGSIGSKHHTWGGVPYGFDAAMPITFRFGKGRHWDIRIEPFDTFVRGTKATGNYFGFRNSVGYRF